MQPVPVPTSSTRTGASAASGSFSPADLLPTAASTPSRAASTRTSVSGRGMSTPSSQRRTMWRKGISPVTYWSGSPAARRSIAACMAASSSASSGLSKLT